MQLAVGVCCACVVRVCIVYSIPCGTTQRYLALVVHWCRHTVHQTHPLHPWELCLLLFVYWLLHKNIISVYKIAYKPPYTSYQMKTQKNSFIFAAACLVKQSTFTPCKMPLLLVCGRPCTGKSTVTKLVAKALESAGCDVIIVDEPTAHIDKNKMHKGTWMCCFDA